MDIENQSQFESHLKISLPQSFDFYHLGKVKIIEEESLENDNFKELLNSLAHKRGIGLRIHTLEEDLNAYMIVLIDADLDLETYSELGNILASQISNNLSRNQIDSYITPPHILSVFQLRKAVASQRPQIQREYIHLFKDKMIPIQTLIYTNLPDQSIHYV